jgi:hypothetical protein
MADSGLIHENIPLFPLIQPERKLDVIIALDAVSHPNQPLSLTLIAFSSNPNLFRNVSQSADGSDEDDPNLYACWSSSLTLFVDDIFEGR